MDVHAIPCLPTGPCTLIDFYTSTSVVYVTSTDMYRSSEESTGMGNRFITTTTSLQCNDGQKTSVAIVAYSSDGHNNISRPLLLWCLVVMDTVMSVARHYYGL
jgi:hypothetical protein